MSDRLIVLASLALFPWVLLGDAMDTPVFWSMLAIVAGLIVAGACVMITYLCVARGQHD